METAIMTVHRSRWMAQETDSRRRPHAPSAERRRLSGPHVVFVMAAVPLLWVVAGLPTAGLVWGSVLVLIGSMLTAAKRARSDTRARSLSEADEDAEARPIPARVLHIEASRLGQARDSHQRSGERQTVRRS